MVQQAIDTFGGLDILVNNAGFVRDRMLVNTSEEEWDAVIRVHLKGHFAPLRHAGAWWRTEAKEGRQRGSPGGEHLVRRRHAGLDRADDVLGRQGRHRRDDAGGGRRARSLRGQRQRDRTRGAHPDDRGRLPRDDGAADGGAEDAFDAMDPANNSPIVAWLASEDCDVTGRVIEIEGGQICVEEGWRHGPKTGHRPSLGGRRGGCRPAQARRQGCGARPGLRCVGRQADPGLAESWRSRSKSPTRGLMRLCL